MESPGRQIWAEVSEAFGRLRGEQVRSLWFEDARPHSFSRGLFTLDVKDASKKEAIDSCYRKDIESIFLDITGSPVRLRTRVAAPGETAPMDTPRAPRAPTPPPARAPREGGAAGHSIPALGDTRHAETASGKLALAAVKRLVEPDAEGFHALFVHGPAGCGKTALAAHALRLLAERDPTCDPLVLSGEALARDVRLASRKRTFGALQSRWAQHDAIVLDEAHRLRGQPVSQTVTVSLLAPVLSRGGRVLVLSRHTPRDIHGLDDRLLSHFESGLVVAMGQPDDADRASVLQAVSETLPSVVEQEALQAIVERCPGSLTEAVELLRRASHNAKEAGREVRLADVESRLVRLGSGPRNIQTLVEMLCSETGVSPDRLRSSEKSRDVASLRHLCVYLASRSLGMSSRQICRALRVRSPSIVAYARRSVDRRRLVDPDYERLIHVLQARLAGAQRDLEF